MTNLTPVQRKALALAHNSRGFGWFLDMGLGKTLLALTEFDQMVKANKKVSRLVVVAPNTFKIGWKTEIEKHGFDFDVHVYNASRHGKAEAFVARGIKGTDHPYTKPPVLIVNYEAVRLDKTLDLIADFAEHRAVTLVLDESISIKNPQAKRTKALLSIAPIFTAIRLLSGRPMTQGPHDLWAQLWIIGAVKERFWPFRNRYCRMGGWQGREILGAVNEEELQARMAPVTFQAAKFDWLEDMPEKLYTERDYDLGPVLGPKYKEMEQVFLTWLAERGASKRVEVTVAIAQYRKLLQIQCGFIHDEGGVAQPLVEDRDNPRLATLMATLEETSGKVAICYSHRYVGEQLARLFPEAAHIQGGMKQNDIEGEKERFNVAGRCRHILLQEQASKFGHTLLGNQVEPRDRCSTMIFYENDYSLDTRTQIEDRIHRIGQRAKGCLYVDLIGSEMDRHVIHALQRKAGIYEAVMGAGGIKWGKAA